MTEATGGIAASIDEIERRIGPGSGLPEDVFLFVSRLTPLVNVDLLIRNDTGQTLLTWRSDRFHGPGWHVPGGIIRFKERAEDRIRAVAAAELGTTVDYDTAPMFVQQSIAAARRDRGHLISLLYSCRLKGEPDPQRRYVSGTPRAEQWAWQDGPPADLIAEQLAYAAFMR